MDQGTLVNLFSEHRLQDFTLDFIENLKFLDFHNHRSDRFDVASYTSGSPRILKKIIESEFESGFCESFSLEPSKQHLTERFQSFKTINNHRKSTRKFSVDIMSFEELSNFLSSFYSITGSESINYGRTTINRRRRNIASGGGIYSTEIHIVNNRIAELPKGIFRYNVYESKLELIRKLDTSQCKEEFYQAILSDDKQNKAASDAENASCFLIFSSILNKHTFKYKDFGVLLAFIELGQFIHSAYLTSSALDLGCCIYGGMLNNKISKMLDIKNSLHIPFAYMTVGKNL